jgi:hypothetical protein
MQLVQRRRQSSAARRPAAAIVTLAVLGGTMLPARFIAHSIATAADPDPARAAREKALAADQASVRQTIAGLQPTDATLEALAKATAEADKPLFDAALAARKRAVDAGNAFLARLVPETDDPAIERERDGWIRIQNDLELANLALAFANERNRMAIARGAERAAAAGAMPDVVSRDEARLAARRALLEANLRLRIAERERRVAGRSFEESLRNP